MGVNMANSIRFGIILAFLLSILCETWQIADDVKTIERGCQCQKQVDQ